MGPFTIGQVPSSPQVFNLVDTDGSPRNLTTYSTINVNIIDPDGIVIDPAVVGTISPVTSPINQIVLNWSNVSPFTKEGVYRYQFQFNGPGAAVDYSAIGSFNVDDPLGGSSVQSWATVQDVANITGQNVTEDQLIAAQMTIDLVTNRTPATSGQIRARDLVWLKRAVAYQAVWQVAQYDFLTRSMVEGISQDGLTAKFPRKSNIYMAPLAERALKNVQWMRSRSLRVQTPLIDGDISTFVSPAGNDLIDTWIEFDSGAGAGWG